MIIEEYPIFDAECRPPYGTLAAVYENLHAEAVKLEAERDALLLAADVALKCGQIVGESKLHVREAVALVKGGMS